jgi:hypothetical protein
MPGGTHVAILGNGEKLQVSRLQSRNCGNVSSASDLSPLVDCRSRQSNSHPRPQFDVLLKTPGRK